MDLQTENPTSGGSHRPLKVLIAGAGIGGLTAAIGLRRQGHDVTIFEQSKFANETGAAIHLAPNCNGILRRLGVYAETFGANSFEGIAHHSPAGDLLHAIDLKPSNAGWQHPYHLVHRAELHNVLKRTATEQDGKGKAATLKLSSRVAEVGYGEDAFIELENGERCKGDVIIGADGVHSRTRAVITGSVAKPFDCGKSAFRFLIPRQTLLDDPITRKYAEQDNCLSMFFANDRRLVMYPCQNSTVLNFVAIHPSAESQGTSGDWNEQGNKELLLKVYQEFGEPVRAILSKADPANLKTWTLLDMEPITTWTKGRLAIMGDSAHPFLPHQGQGGGVAIEDAASLAVLLHEDVPRDEIPERLKLYEKCRVDRANNIQQYTRLAGRDADEIKRSGKELNMMEYTNYNLGHDEWDNTTQALRNWLWAREPKTSWRMPMSFGPMTGPRQDPFGRFRDTYQCSSVTASIKFKTSRTLLQNMLPTTAFSFQSPNTVAYATLSCTTLNGLDWLGGGGYNHLGLYLHGVQYIQKDGSVVTGSYLAVLFEDFTDPIITGRDELGMPKIFSNINIDRRDRHLRITTAWRGVTFGEFEWESLKSTPTPAEVDGEPSTLPKEPKSEDAGILTYRYIPSVGDRGKPDAEYAVLIPYGDPPKEIEPKTELRATKAHVSFTPHDWNTLPTLHNVASRLAEIPIYSVEEAKAVEAKGIVGALQPRKLE